MRRCTVTIPRFSFFYGQNRRKEFRQLLARLYAVMATLTLPAITGLYMLSSDIITIISGSQYGQSQYSLRILCFALFFSIFGWILTSCVLIPAKREMTVMRNSLISAVMNIGLNFIFIPLWAERGAAMTTVISEAAMTVLNAYCARDILRGLLREYHLTREFITCLASCIGIVVVCWVCAAEIHSFWVRIVASCVGSVFIYGVLLLATENKTALGMIKKLSILRKVF